MNFLPYILLSRFSVVDTLRAAQDQRKKRMSGSTRVLG